MCVAVLLGLNRCVIAAITHLCGTAGVQGGRKCGDRFLSCLYCICSQGLLGLGCLRVVVGRVQVVCYKLGWFMVGVYVLVILLSFPFPNTVPQPPALPVAAGLGGHIVIPVPLCLCVCTVYTLAPDSAHLS